MSSYSYSISNDVTSGAVNTSILTKEIRASSIVIALESVTVSGNSLTIVFKSGLTGQEETTLDALVLAHNGNAIDPDDPIDVAVTQQPPFAKPDFRTKRDATGQWESLIENEIKVVDYYLTQERYVSGGEIMYKNSKEGDYVTAEVYDKDGVIPVPYRAALCENHPSIASYLVKKWILPTEENKYGSTIINTYPLNAKVSAGLYLRVTYYASAVTGTRKIAIDYHLTKSLI